MRRTLAMAVAIGFAAFPAVADAARFKVTVSGKQTDTISGPVPAVNGGCDYTANTTGSSTYKFKTKKAATVRYPSEYPGNVRLAVTASGKLQSNTVLNPGQNAAECPPGSTINETCSAKKKSKFSAYLFPDDKIFRAGRGEQDLMLKKCSQWGRFSGLGGLVSKKFSLKKIERKKGLVIKGKVSDTRLIHGIGNLTTTLSIKARIKPAGK